MSHVFAVTSAKGGVGKTTAALALSHGLARKLEQAGSKESVLLVDLDPQGHCAPCLGLQPERCAGELLLGHAHPEEIIIRADRSRQSGPSRPNLYLLPATGHLAIARMQLLADIVAEALLAGVGRLSPGQPSYLVKRLQDLFADLRQVFAFVVVDYPSPLDLFWEAVYHGVDGCIVPVKADYLSAKSAIEHWTRPADQKVEALVPTFVRARQVLSEQTLQELTRHFGSKRLSRPIPASVRVAEAPAAGGQTIFEYAPNSAPARAYWNLVERVYDSKV